MTLLFCGFIFMLSLYYASSVFQLSAHTAAVLHTAKRSQEYLAALAFRPIAGTPLTIHSCFCDDVPA
jgi:hypothetical protein